jgi:hypothetical protein
MKTIFVSSRYFDNKDFMRHLDKKKFKLVDNIDNTDFIDFIYVDHTTSRGIKKKLYDLRCGYMNHVVTTVDFHDKSILHNYVKAHSRKLYDTYFMKQYDLKRGFASKLPNNGMYIVKPIPGFAGKGIRVFKGVKKIEKYVEKYRNARNQKPNWVIQKYIERPLLLDGRKFHMRVIMFIYKNDVYMYKEFITYPAKKKYDPDNLNMDIHDSHGTATESHEKKMFPSEFSNMKNVKEIYADIISLLKGLKNIGMFKTKCYENVEKCYEFYGIDIMLTNKYQVKCIEINYKPGFTNFLKRMPDLIKGMLDITLLNNENGEGYYKI